QTTNAGGGVNPAPAAQQKTASRGSGGRSGPSFGGLYGQEAAAGSSSAAPDSPSPPSPPPPSAGAMAWRRLSLMRPWSSTLMTFTFTMSPILTTSPTFLT